MEGHKPQMISKQQYLTKPVQCLQPDVSVINSFARCCAFSGRQLDQVRKSQTSTKSRKLNISTFHSDHAPCQPKCANERGISTKNKEVMLRCMMSCKMFIVVKCRQICEHFKRGLLRARLSARWVRVILNHFRKCRERGGGELSNMA